MTLVLASIIASLVAQEQEAPRSYTARQVIERAVEKGIENDKLKNEVFNYKKHERKEELDDNNNVKKLEETTTYRVFDRDGEVLEQLIEKNGEVIEDSEAKPGLSNPGSVDFNTILLEKYDFEISHKMPLYWQNKLGIYIIDFHPKEDLVITKKEDRLLNKLEGTIFIDRYFDTWSIDARLPEDEDVSPAWGIFGKMHSFELTMKQKKIDNIMVIDEVVVFTKYRILWSTTHEKRTRTYIDYERRIPLQ